MSEVMQTQPRRDTRHRLLLTASSAALLVLAGGARAEDADRPTVWIELGGGFNQLSRDAQGWSPPNLTDPITHASPEPFGYPPKIGYDFDAAVSVQPHSSDWIFTASVRYGRAQRGPIHVHDQTYEDKPGFFSKYHLTTYAFLNATEKTSASHAIIDFKAGKDIGLGFSHAGQSTLDFGIRVAQLTERADATMTAFSTLPVKYVSGELLHEADALFTRSYTGAGPSVSWEGAEPFLGSMEHGATFDWGVNAAILFGRQKASLHLHTKDTRYHGYGAHETLSQTTLAPDRDRTVVVPNLGGFAGVSWRLSAGKVSLGYRADFFFGAIDGGIATAQRETRAFYGPFASVSLGLGG
jgi:hypothetical protein